MKIVEIFGSIEGEGSRAGSLCTFIRSFGCCLRCKWCDTNYSYFTETNQDEVSKTLKDMTVAEIVDEVKRIGYKKVTFTGGEPLIQSEAVELITTLAKQGFWVNIETNGAVDIANIIHNNKKVNLRNYNEPWVNNIMFTMDYKCPSSGMTDKMVLSNFNYLNENDVVKFVVGNHEDLEEMRKVIADYYKEGDIFVSPVFGQIELTEIVDYLKEHDLQQVRMQLQLHKIIWDPAKRGV